AHELGPTSQVRDRAEHMPDRCVTVRRQLEGDRHRPLHLYRSTVRRRPSATVTPRRDQCEETCVTPLDSHERLTPMLEVAPLTATIGAEVAGVDLADDLEDAAIEEIREALLEWKVLFFRDQHRLDRARHVAFGRRFGELEVHPITPAEQEQPEVFVI